MTLHDYEVGVRELHDRLSEHLNRVEQGASIIVKRRGTPIARLSAVAGESVLADLVRRGLLSLPQGSRTARHARVEPQGSVSEFVGEQRR